MNTSFRCVSRAAGPSTTEADFVDYHQRVLDWYFNYLGEKKPAAASDGARR